MTIFQQIPTFILHRAQTNVHPLSVTDWIEIDVRRSSDGTLIVFHDETLATGERAGSLLYDHLHQLGVRSLDEFLSSLPAGINLVLDVKNSIDDATCEQHLTTAWLAACAARRIAEDRSVLLTSFDPSIVVRASQYEPTVRIGLTTWKGVPLRESIPTAAAFQVDVLSVHIDSLRPDGIELGDSMNALASQAGVAHSAGLQLACWGVPELTAADVRYLADLGLDAIYVDEENLSRLFG